MTRTDRAGPVLHEAVTPAAPRGVVLVLHGGRATSTEPTRERHASVLRMRPFVRALRASAGAQDLAVWRLRFAVRGWNGPLAAPVADARWALALVRERFGRVPVALVGHSMGGRTALRVADDDAVTTIVALAPWVPSGEPLLVHAGQFLTVLHGERDRWTDPSASLDLARRAGSAGAGVTYVRISGDGHGMLRHPGLWHDLTTAAVIDGLGDQSAGAAGANSSTRAGTAAVRLLP